MATETDAARVRLFSNGTQFGDWEAANCARCTKWSDDASKCGLMMAIAEAAMTDGTVSAEDAASLGCRPDATLYVWRCPSFEKDETIPPPPPPPTPLQELRRDLEAAREKVMAMLERAGEMADYAEGSPYPEGPWGDEVVDGALAQTWLDGALEHLKRAEKAAG